MSKQWHGGKGSAIRPIVDKQKFSDNWDRIFGKKEQLHGKAHEEEKEPKRWQR